MITTENTLWVEKYRPTTLDTYVGNDFIKDVTSGCYGDITLCENDTQKYINKIFFPLRPGIY